jgi:hypothetical protein
MVIKKKSFDLSCDYVTNRAADAVKTLWSKKNTQQPDAVFFSGIPAPVSSPSITTVLAAACPQGDGAPTRTSMVAPLLESMAGVDEQISRNLFYLYDRPWNERQLRIKFAVDLRPVLFHSLR